MRKDAPAEMPVGERAYQAIRQAIVESRFPPGARLIERELIEMTGASRTIVREVLNRLAGDGLVKTLPRQTVVAYPSLREAEELYEVRGLLISSLTRRFSKEATQEDVEQLRAAVREYAATDDPAAWPAARDRIYAILGKYARTTHSILEGLNARVAVHRSLSSGEPGRHAASVAELTRLADAVARGDEEAAARASLEHTEAAKQSALRALARHPWYKADLHSRDGD